MILYHWILASLDACRDSLRYSRPTVNSLVPTLDSSALRKTIRAQRLALSESEVTTASARITKHCAPYLEDPNHQHIAFYEPFNHEVDTHPLRQLAHHQGKTLYLPILSPKANRELIFAPITSTTSYHENRFGIMEPVVDEAHCVKGHSLDLAFLPLVAFDDAGNRLGMGAGFYDRTFAFRLNTDLKKPRLIGLAYEFQRVDALPRQPWDVPLDGVVTEIKTP